MNWKNYQQIVNQSRTVSKSKIANQVMALPILLIRYRLSQFLMKISVSKTFQLPPSFKVYLTGPIIQGQLFIKGHVVPVMQQPQFKLLKHSILIIYSMELILSFQFNKSLIVQIQGLMDV